MPCATITITDTGEIPSVEEPPELTDKEFYLMLAGVALITIVMIKR